MKKTSLRASIENPGIAQWLREHEETIVASWLRALEQVDLGLAEEPTTQEAEYGQLKGFFCAIVATVETANSSDLDSSVQDLVRARMEQGDTVETIAQMVDELKRGIWRMALDLLPSGQALETVAALEPVFVLSAAQLVWLAERSAGHQLQEELERTRRILAKMDRTRSDFISIATHELKTPLALIQGYAAILSQELAEQKQYDNLVQGLANGVRRLNALIEDMIDVGQIDSNMLSLSLEPASLYEIARMVIRDLEQELKDRSLNIQVYSFPQEVEVIYLDAKRMYQVLSNLIGNAIKYTPDNGSITLDSRVLRDPEPDRRFLEISIADTGIGIAPDDLPLIFKKFYRVGEIDLHSTSKTHFKGGGPGLGLVIAKGLVEAHGGRIWAESPGYDERNFPGSTFHIMLPIYTELPESPLKHLLGLDDEHQRWRF